ncbi:uncharacterized protein LOC126750851 [Bactrocera neohumeralis]|uniref:uncharacterized protein LOC126750851 n=1 Tax=Bactrocera neohumeralis TaxID=98809 RepID=UPI0021666118|nr:uncharacterized protein LOC126750851 [Bactrocera neohumeralis]XP_050316580.1 uncharacterized protein LOC126750851 [Bactrocera neohumeralis]
MAHNTDSTNDLDKFQREDHDDRSANVPTSNPSLYDKSQSLVDIANNTFKELCRTLENEQSKLMELEERRKKLQEEMQRLKQEIEEEKHTYRLNLVESLTENAEAMSAKSMETDEDSGSEIQNKLYTCYEADEIANATGTSPASYSADEDDNKHPNEIARNIQKKLQSVVAECVIEQCAYDEPALETEILDKPST